MSYHHRQPVRVAMGSDAGAAFWSKVVRDIGAPAGGQAAVDEACAERMQTASSRMEGDRYTVVANLQKRTFYRTVDFEKILYGVQAMVTRAKDDLWRLRTTDWGSVVAMPAIDEEMLQLYARLRESIPYQQNLNLAKQNGIEIIDAPGLWRWVEKSLIDVELATGVIAYVACKKPAWLAVVQWMYEASTTLIGIVRLAASVAIDLAVAAGKGILKIPDTLGTIWTIAKWGAILGGGLWIASKARGDASVGAMLKSFARRGSK